MTGFGSVDFQGLLTVALANDTRFDPTQLPGTLAPGSNQNVTQTQGSSTTSTPSASPSQTGASQGNSAMQVGCSQGLASFLALVLLLAVVIA